MAIMYRLFCAHDGCGFILGQTRCTDDTRRGCPRCHRRTDYTFQGGRMIGTPAPPKPKKVRPRPRKPPNLDVYDHLMRANRYVDVAKCL